MRHLRSILYALVLAPAVWILCGVGFDQDLTGRARDNGGIESVTGILLLLLAGAAYAILLFSPISPAGPLLAGLVFAGVGAWARIAPDSYAGVWPANIASEGFNVSTPGYGLAVLLAVPLLATALSARRWRGFEPPEILLIGTIGRARGAAQVAGTPMAAERTTVIPQQRQAPAFVPGFGAPSADATQLLTPHRPVDDDGDEKTTVIRLGAGPSASREEPTRIVAPASDDNLTEDFAADKPTEPISEPAVAAGPTLSRTTGADEPTLSRTTGAEETTRDVLADADAGDETTRLVLPSAHDEPVTEALTDDGDEKTQLITLPSANGAGSAERDDRTHAIRTGTVEPPGDRTQLLTFPTPGEAATVPNPVAAPVPPVSPASSVPPAASVRSAEPVVDEDRTTAMSIVAAERPDPGEDPTTRLTPPGEATTRATPGHHPTTVSGLERPADEAADDTRPLKLPSQRPPAEEDVTQSR